MNKLKFFSVLSLSLAMAGVSKAQFDYIKPDDMDQLHSRTLIVIVEKTTDQMTDKLKKKKKADKVAEYGKAIDAFNKNFGDAIGKYWKVSEGEVQYKTLDEANDIPLNEKKNYVVLFCRSAKQADLTTSYETTNGIVWWPDMKEVAHDRDLNDKMTVLGMAMLDKLNKTPFYQFAIPDLYPNKADMDYAINAASTYIMYRVNHRKDNPKKLDEQMLVENQPTLRDKTLLIRREWLDKKLLANKAELEKDYPFPYMIAGRDTIDRMIDSADAKYAVAMVVPNDLAAAPSGGLQYVQYVYNCEDGAILASSGIADMPSDPKGGIATNSTKPLITKRTLLDFSLYIRDSNESGDKKKKGRK